MRRQIAEMVERTRKHPSIAMVAEEFMIGYLTALIDQRLLSSKQWQQLAGEMRNAAKTARAG